MQLMLSAPQSEPAMMAFQRFYSKLLYELQSWIVPVTVGCNTYRLIPDDVTQTIKCSDSMRSDQRVTLMLDAVQTSIRGDHRSLRRFVRVLKKQKSSVELVGTKLYHLYCKFQQQ